MQRKKGPQAKFDQVYEKVRIQVNVRDNSLSSNEGTGTFNNFGQNMGTISPAKIDRVRAGFNVSYDSNSF